MGRGGEGIYGGAGLQRGTKKLLRVMDIFVILKLSQVYAGFETQIVYFRYEQCIVCRLDLYKTV